ncbi:MAG: bifunctional phosphoribosylaminoimidazolecarboxamide formyltransferase/IMP cyclohydrolase [Candidatus Zixiibacteriota bacterium]
MKRALLSVSDKRGIEQLGMELSKLGVEIISTGGTLKVLREAGVQAISVSTFTGSPEILGGRVKTLHPKVFAGILYRRSNESDIDELKQSDYRPIDLIVVNLYPFEETVKKQGVSDEEVIEHIDVGGPSMLRAAAKNFESVTVVVDTDDYPALLEQLQKKKGQTSLAFRRQCAGKVYAVTSRYDHAITSYFARGLPGSLTADQFPEKISLGLTRARALRYGENPHQSASLYSLEGFAGASLIHAQVLAGKELSYNNYNDLNACLDMVLEFDEPFACVVKHTNPCGAAIGKTIAEAYQKAYDSDPLSAYGSIIGLNREVDMECAKVLHETPFVECVLAPGYTAEALELLKKKKNRRLLSLGDIAMPVPTGRVAYQSIRGGMLVQSADEYKLTESQLTVVSKRQPQPNEIADLLFTWKVVKHTKSNAIVLAKNGATVGIGMGQTSRVDSAFMAVKRAGERAHGAVMASDAFFPMPDGVEVATNAGVTAIIQPGGSQNDSAAIEAADKAEAAMVVTGVRHFKH